IIPDKGKILLDDTDITYVKEYQRASYIGRLFQDPLKGTAPNMTIEENLALACLSAKEKKSPFSWITNKERELFKEQLKMLDMGLEDRMHTLVGNLSGGQRQALTLLMATIVPPKLLLLDEHTAALDPKAAAKIMKLTQEIVQKYHITCLMVTHQMQQALEVGDRTIMMDDGHIVIDIKGEQRANMSVYDLMERFHTNTGSNLADDRILLAK
ncbi:MAG: ATP-binding cassette domain-containing protein, partial [Solobacterium sp.]|nr:ATP-binding cassette domain-containing protein [Solobacterium sp.]